MSVADCRRARDRMRQRYKGARVHGSVSERIEAERQRAVREANRKKSSKK